MQKHADVPALSCRHVEGSTMAIYEIRVKGHLDQRWSAWFDGLTVTHLQDGDTMLAGQVVD